MIIETWVAALIFIFMGGIAIVAIANAMCLEDKLTDAYEEISNLKDDIGDYKVAIEKFRREEIIRLANDYFKEEN